MSKLPKCYLHCAEKSHPPIFLPHNKEIIVGRSPNTKITEKRCSKCQLSFVANTSNFTVKVKQVGPNTSALNDVILGKGHERVASHGDTVHFLLGMYKHFLLFDPAPVNSSEKHENRKRQPDSIKSPDKKKQRVDADEPPTDKWESISGGKLLVFESRDIKSSSKIAAYDMDGTLIITKSGRVFPLNEEDWKIQWNEIPHKLESLHNDGYKIVIFTNQAGISRGKTSASQIKIKIERIITELKVPAQAFVATGDSLYRKPAPGMWDFLVSEKNSGEGLDMAATFYCGDAAGRPEGWAIKKKKDFSCSDRLFAKNLGLKFFTPEEHFLNQKSQLFNLPDFNPSALPLVGSPLVEPSSSKITSDKQELLLMVGFPGSGKSFVCQTYILPAGYIHVNRDTLGSMQKCISAAKTGLERGKSVVVDNTNPDVESRSKFVEIAKKFNVGVRCAVMNSSITQARHNNKFRALIGEPHEPVSEMVINSYKSKYQEPDVKEGLDEVIKVNVIPKFSNPDHERLFRMYLLDRY